MVKTYLASLRCWVQSTVLHNPCGTPFWYPQLLEDGSRRQKSKAIFGYPYKLHKIWKEARMDRHCFLILITLVQGTTVAWPNETDLRSRLPRFPALALKHTSHLTLTLITLFANGYSNSPTLEGDWKMKGKEALQCLEPQEDSNKVSSQGCTASDTLRFDSEAVT